MELKSYIKRYYKKDNFFVCTIRSISHSGYTRKIDFYIRKGKSLVSINKEISEVLSMKQDSRGLLIVKGCGMDMIFDTLYQFLLGLNLDDNYANYYTII